MSAWQHTHTEPSLIRPNRPVTWINSPGNVKDSSGTKWSTCQNFAPFVCLSNRLIEMLRHSLIRGRGSPLVGVSISTELLTDASTHSLTLSSSVHISTGHAVISDQRLAARLPRPPTVPDLDGLRSIDPLPPVSRLLNCHNRLYLKSSHLNSSAGVLM